MFKKNHCPGCGQVTGWRAGETCSPDCKSRVEREKLRVAHGSREHYVPILEQIDAESQRLAVRSSAHAILLEYGTRARTLAKIMRAHPFDRVPEGMVAQFLAIEVGYTSNKHDLELKPPRLQREPEVSEEEWLQVRPLTEFERAARRKKVVTYDPAKTTLSIGGREMRADEVLVGVDMAMGNDAHGETVATILTRDGGGKMHVVTNQKFNDVGYEDAKKLILRRVEKVNPPRMRNWTEWKCDLDKGTFEVRPIFGDIKLPLFTITLGRGLHGQLDDFELHMRQHLAPMLTTDTDLESMKAEIASHAFDVITVGAYRSIEWEKTIDGYLKAHVIVDRRRLPPFAFDVSTRRYFREQLGAFARHLQQHIGRREQTVTIPAGANAREHKVKVSGRYDGATGEHLDKLAKTIGLERTTFIDTRGKYLETDASLRERMYEHDAARGGGTDTPIAPVPRSEREEVARRDLDRPMHRSEPPPLAWSVYRDSLALDACFKVPLS